MFVVAVAARATWYVVSLGRATDAQTLEFDDEIQYWNMAQGLIDGRGLPDELGFQATRMPLYPALLSIARDWEHGLFWVRLAQWIVGGLGAVATALLASRIGGIAAAWIAGLLFACDPFFIFFSSLLLTETLFLTVLAVVWLVAARLIESISGRRPGPWDWVLLGMVSALAVFTRESTLGLIVLLLMLVVVASPARTRAAAGATLALAIVLLALTPWAARNARVTGEWVWLTTRGGISLYDGVRPGATGASDLGDVKQSPDVKGLSEIEWNRYFTQQSFAIIRNEPGRIARLAVQKVGRMWNPFPNVETYQSATVRWVSAGWTIPTFGLAILGAVVLPTKRGRRGTIELLLLGLPAVYLTLLHSIFVGSVRYRLGAMPMLYVLAACGVVVLLGRYRMNVKPGSKSVVEET